MKNKIIKLDKIVAGICLCAMIFTNISLPTYAISPAEEEVQKYIKSGQVEPEQLVFPDECKTVLLKGNGDNIKGFEPELKSFLEFLDANFKNKSSTSSLTALAIARYREYRDALRAQFKYVQVGGSRKAVKDAEAQADEDMSVIPYYLASFEDTVNTYAVCEEMVNTYISLGREKMIEHIKQSVSQKKTIMLVEKFKALNIKLRGLNMKIAEMFALFATFKNKFPGYAPKSCMKG